MRQEEQAMRDNLLRVDEVSGTLRVNRTTLRRWRVSGDGPPFIRLGPKVIVYREMDLAEWIEQRRNTEARPAR
jgi:predicted DNA-binding transcriptional regulator AlpA